MFFLKLFVNFQVITLSVSSYLYCSFQNITFEYELEYINIIIVGFE